MSEAKKQQWHPNYQAAYWACSHIADDIRRGAFKPSEKGLEQIASLLLEAANRAYANAHPTIISKHNCKLDLDRSTSSVRVHH